MQRSEQWNEIVAALAEAQKAIVPAITRSEAKVETKSGGSYGFKYADLYDVDRACRSALNANGIAIIQAAETDDKPGAVVTTILAHGKSGQWISSQLRMQPTQQTPQGLGSAITYARRYGLAAICGVVTEDDDGANASKPRPEDRKQRPVPPKPSDEQPTRETVYQAVTDWLDIRREDVAGVVNRLKSRVGITGTLQPAEYPTILNEINHMRSKGVTKETFEDAMKPKDND